MKCPHCTVGIHDNQEEHKIPWRGTYADIDVRVGNCPVCHKFFSSGRVGVNPFQYFVPSVMGGRAPPAEVPAAIAADFIEAAAVLSVSPKASAALSRRCLQNVLSAHGYSSRDLVKQVTSFIEEPDASKVAPSSLRETVDAIRNFGNFSAHPIDDKTTLQIIDIEPHEAEWCLDILDEMFDHFYVRPAQAAARKAALNAKLAAAGKPDAK